MEQDKGSSAGEQATALRPAEQKDPQDFVAGWNVGTETEGAVQATQ